MAGSSDDHPLVAYGRAQGLALSARQGDALAFLRAANLLEESCRPRLRARLDAALNRNQRLWTQVQRLLGGESHPLPEPVRTNLLILALFVHRQTLKALVSGDPADVRPLVEINRQIAVGLTDTEGDK